jgi:NAD+ synthetase
MEFKNVKNIICSNLETYLKLNSINNVVIGISGGIDSAICSALAKEIPEINVIGRSLPTKSNKPEEIDRANKIGKYFCDDFKEVKIDEMYEFMWKSMENELPSTISEFDKKIAQGNVKARVRMIYLYNLARLNNAIVLSTDNLTEYNLGFWTLHGDVGDYGMIQNLWKTEVYELSNYMVCKFNESGLYEKADALDLCIKAVPTDGLGITNSDLDQIGAKSYNEVDKILRKYLGSKQCDKDLFNSPVIQRHVNSEFKRNNPANIERKCFE